MQPDEETQDKPAGSLIEEDAAETPAAAEDEESDEAGMPGMDSDNKEDDEIVDGAPETAPTDETTPAA